LLTSGLIEEQSNTEGDRYGDWTGGSESVAVRRLGGQRLPSVRRHTMTRGTRGGGWGQCAMGTRRRRQAHAKYACPHPHAVENVD
jgi:hypothetical protein